MTCSPPAAGVAPVGVGCQRSPSQATEATRALSRLLWLIVSEADGVSCESVAADLAARGIAPASGSAVSRALNGVAVPSADMAGAVLLHAGPEAVARAAARMVQAEGEGLSVVEAMLDNVASHAQLTAAVRAALSDGELSGREVDDLRRSAAAARADLDQLDAAIAAGRA